MSEHQEMILELPKESVDNSCGIGIDIGGSAIKITYRHIDDRKDYLKHKEDVSKAKVRLRIYSRERLEEALHYISKNCHITRDGDQSPVMMLTGVGGYQNDKMIATVLNVKTQQIWEGKCLVYAFIYLSTILTQEEFEYLPSDEEKVELRHVMDGIRRMEILFAKTTRVFSQWYKNPETLDLISALNYDVDRDQPIAKAVADMYPCLLFAMNSASTFVVVNSSTSYGRITAINNGGKTFLGLGSLLCGTTKTYDELIDMAEKGNYANVDQTLMSLQSEKSSKPQNDVYSSIFTDEETFDDTLYGFGKAASASPDSFRKEDIIRSLLKMTARHHVGTIFPVILATGFRHVFVVGSFCQRRLVRTVMRKEFVRQKVTIASRNNGKGLDAQIHFVKSAPYLCSIGAFMSQSEATELSG